MKSICEYSALGTLLFMQYYMFEFKYVCVCALCVCALNMNVQKWWRYIYEFIVSTTIKAVYWNCLNCTDLMICYNVYKTHFNAVRARFSRSKDWNAFIHISSLPSKTLTKKKSLWEGERESEREKSKWTNNREKKRSKYYEIVCTVYVCVKLS